MDPGKMDETMSRYIDVPVWMAKVKVKNRLKFFFFFFFPYEQRDETWNNT